MAGLDIGAWVMLWQQSHNFAQGAPLLIAWPDGGPLIEQPAIVVAMFALIRDEFTKELEAATRDDRQ